MFKQIALNLFFQIITFIINLLISFFLTPFIVNNMGSEAYGFVGLANNFIQYIQLFTVALNSMAARYITISYHKKDYMEASKYYSSVFFGNIFLILVLTPLSLLFILNIEKYLNVSSILANDVKILWILILVQFLFNLISSVFGTSLFAVNRLDIVSKINGISSIFKVTFLVAFFYFFQARIWHVGAASALSGFIMLSLNWNYSRQRIKNISIRKELFNVKSIKILLTSGIWSSVSKLSGILSLGFDLLIANLFIGQIAMGTLSIAKTIPLMILSVFNLISNVLAPYLTIKYAEEKNIYNSLVLIIKCLGIFSSSILAGFTVFSHDFYSLWVPSQNISLLSKVSFIAIVHFVILLPILPLNNIFTVYNKLKIPSFSVFISGTITFITEIYFIRLVDDLNLKIIIIVLSSTVIEFLRVSLFLPIYSAQCLQLSWFAFYKPILKNIASYVFLVILYTLFKNYVTIYSWTILIIIALILLLVGTLLNWFLILNKKERLRLINYLKSKI